MDDFCQRTPITALLRTRLRSVFVGARARQMLEVFYAQTYMGPSNGSIVFCGVFYV
jgi:hypothetical protein